jgi:hypothetical protein
MPSSYWMRTTSRKSLLRVLGIGLLFGLSACSLPADEEVVANYVITSADDFLVSVYHNGDVVPDDRRHLISERFGATSERIDTQVKPGDWIVFHVVCDPMRWGGVRYFAAAGLFEKGEFGFVSQPDSRNWSACDDTSRAAKFIAKKDFMSNNPAQKITRLWLDGDGLMKQFAGDSWSGQPLWGRSCDTWLKFIVPGPTPPQIK